MEIRTICRVVTTHDDAGSAIVLFRDEVPVVPYPLPGMKAALVWSSSSVPADNIADVLGGKRDQGGGVKAGSALWITEFGPGLITPMHRTLSLDYGVVLSGELELALDGGEVVRLGVGDVVVQRGTNHAWRNPDPVEPCRILMVLIQAEPVTAGGQPLPGTLE